MHVGGNGYRTIAPGQAVHARDEIAHRRYAGAPEFRGHGRRHDTTSKEFRDAFPGEACFAVMMSGSREKGLFVTLA
jgi:hypothetical protein